MNNISNYLKEKFNNFKATIENIKNNSLSLSGVDNYDLRKYAMYFLIFAGASLIIFIGVKTTNNESRLAVVENGLSDKAISYLKKNNISINNGESKFLSFNEIGYNSNTKCNNAGGVLVTKNDDNYNYQYYYNCGNNTSDNVQKVINDNKDALKYISIKGANPIYISSTDVYSDIGYELLDDSANVTVNNGVKAVEGVYYVEYVVSVNDKQYTAKRMVIVNESLNNNVPNQNKPTITLVGGNESNTLRGGDYNELGFKAKDASGNDITDKVIVTDNTDLNTVGTYDIVYSVTSDNGLTTTVTRKVNVIDVQLTLSGDQYTSKNLTVNATITGDNYYYTTLPNYNKSFATNFTYNVINNGKYTFTVYSNTGNAVSKDIFVDLIDSEAPNGVCYMSDNGNVYVYANDSKSGVSGYSYLVNNNYTSYSESYTYKVSSNKNDVPVRIMDKAGNTGYITCKGSGSSDTIKKYDPIVPSSFTDRELTDSFKVWLIKKDGYYIVQFWAENPYLQFHTYDASMHGNAYDSIASLFNHALSKDKNGIKNKLTIAFNSDVSVYYDSYYACRRSSNSACSWNNYTNGALIVRDGKTYRYDLTTNGRRSPIYTITKDNKMIIINDKNNRSLEVRTAAFKQAIDGQARNTAMTLTLLMDDGQILTDKNNPKNYSHLYKPDSGGTERNALCQVNNNNFIYIIAENKGEGFLAKKMKELNCYVAVHNDGGGSTNFWWKKSTKTSWTKIHGTGSRGRMDAIVYWTEL